MNVLDLLVIDGPASVAALRQALKDALTPDVMAAMVDAVDAAELTAIIDAALIGDDDQEIVLSYDLSSP